MVRFLIADDDSTCRDILQLILSLHGQCDLVHDGREAVAAYRIALDSGAPYDLVCLDIMMPEMNGHDTLKAIREIEKERHILGSDGVQVLMLTASDDPKDCIQAFKLGCECYVPKPIQDRTLLAEVRRLLPELPEVPVGVPRVAPPPNAESMERLPDKDRFRCLIVDDDRVCRELLRDMLHPVAECDFAYDGSEAVEFVRLAMDDETPYQLICLDIMMPGMDGHAALAAIRKLETKHGIRGSDAVKVIMTTALRDSKHCIQSFKEGCECYLTKPFVHDQLFEKLQSMGFPREPAPATAS